ncbi:hypothetical protein Bbelb_339890 [Branchiostoma belcheri]|nr:hypothetical protein Bbelb_339890 [Branchiostoma belcheri]
MAGSVPVESSGKLSRSVAAFVAWYPDHRGGSGISSAPRAFGAANRASITTGRRQQKTERDTGSQRIQGNQLEIAFGSLAVPLITASPRLVHVFYRKDAVPALRAQILNPLDKTRLR